MRMRPIAFGLAALVVLSSLTALAVDPVGKIELKLRSRVENGPVNGIFTPVENPSTWVAAETAIIVCDMWDLHHCENAVKRETEMAPVMDRVIKAARSRGVVIIHAPSGCMAAYNDHPARLHATRTPRSKTLPANIQKWCDKIPSESKGVYPIDQTDGGEDDDPADHEKWAEQLKKKGRNPKAPWKTQVATIGIDAGDYVSDDGEEIWSILEDRKIDNVILMGVHLNMCVLGRPFGLRRLKTADKNVVLMRDMTDTMYNPKAWPRVSHFEGTELIVEHIEKYVCPTITSDQFLGGRPFQFQRNDRP